MKKKLRCLKLRIGGIVHNDNLSHWDIGKEFEGEVYICPCCKTKFYDIGHTYEDEYTSDICGGSINEVCYKWLPGGIRYYGTEIMKEIGDFKNNFEEFYDTGEG